MHQVGDAGLRMFWSAPSRRTGGTVRAARAGGRNSAKDLQTNPLYVFSQDKGRLVPPGKTTGLEAHRSAGHQPVHFTGPAPASWKTAGQTGHRRTCFRRVSFQI